MSDGFVAYQKPDHDTLLARIPLRENSAPVIIVAYDTHLQAGSGNFFFIVQSELGDLYKITLDWKGDKVTMLRIYYFDSIPAANALCITRNGFLFAANQCSDHLMYVFTSLGGKNLILVHCRLCTMTMPLMDDSTSLEVFAEKNCRCVYFKPQQLQNLEICDEYLPSLAPIMKMDIGDLQEKHGNQIFTLSGRGARSTLRVLEVGLEATQLALSTLPGSPLDVWTLKDNIVSKFHRYIVLSFTNATLVMEVGNDGRIAESSKNEFVRDQRTILVGEAGTLE